MDLEAEIERNVSAALAEDVGAGDWTAMLTPEGSSARAVVISRSPAVLCGPAWFNACFRKLDPHVRVTWNANEGDAVERGTALCELAGSARALLTGERTGLNFLQMLSAVATETRRYVQRVMQNVQVYRSRLKDAARSLRSDLERGRASGGAKEAMDLSSHNGGCSHGASTIASLLSSC